MHTQFLGHDVNRHRLVGGFGQILAEVGHIVVQLVACLRLHRRVIIGYPAGVVEHVRDVVEPRLFEGLGGLGAVDRPDRRCDVGGILAQRLVRGLSQIFVTTQTRPGEPDRQDCVLAQELFQLCTQLDRTRLFGSHRMTRRVMPGRVISGRVDRRLSRLRVISMARRTRRSDSNRHRRRDRHRSNL